MASNMETAGLADPEISNSAVSIPGQVSAPEEFIFVDEALAAEQMEIGMDIFFCFFHANKSKQKRKLNKLRITTDSSTSCKS